MKNSGWMLPLKVKKADRNPGRFRMWEKPDLEKYCRDRKTGKGRIVIDGVTLFDAGKKIFLKPQKGKSVIFFRIMRCFRT